MGTKMEADITDLIKPYLDRNWEEARLEARLETRLETAGEMLAGGLSVADVLKFTHLTPGDLIAANLVDKKSVDSGGS